MATAAKSTDADAKISLAFDPDQLTLGELEDFADAAGVEFAQASDVVEVIDEKTGDVKRVRRMKAKGLIALVWILRRRSDPTYTLEDARQVKISGLDMPVEPKKANPTRARRT